MGEGYTPQEQDLNETMSDEDKAALADEIQSGYGSPNIEVDEEGSIISITPKKMGKSVLQETMRQEDDQV